MFYYKVESSHWSGATFEFKSKLKLTEGQCFRISSHSGSRNYPTRFKVVSVSDTPGYTGSIVEILDVDLNVDIF